MESDFNNKSTSQKSKENEIPARTAFFRSIRLFIWELLKVTIVALAIIIPIRLFIAQPFYVKGASMEPTFHDYEYLLIDELTYRFIRPPQRGEIIVFKNPENPSEFFIKRVIGLPNEKIEINQGKIKIYNQAYPEGFYLDESGYLKEEFKDNYPLTELGEDEYFVLGDNRAQSLDSRKIGPIPRHLIIGRTLFRAWPIFKFKKFSAPNYISP